MDPKDAFLAFKDKRIDEDQFARLIFPTLQRLAKVVGYRQGVDPDDLTSELWILTRTKLVETFDPASLPSAKCGIEPFLMGCARLIASPNGVRSLHSPFEETCASDIKRHVGNIEYGGNGTILLEEPDSDITMDEPDPHSESAFSDAYRQRMLDEIQLRLCDNQKKVSRPAGNIGGSMKEEQKNMKKSAVPGVRLVARKRQKIALPMPPKRPPKAAKLSPDQEELVNIRHQLCYSQDVFAKALGIGVPRLASYEYGRTSGVPEKVMDTARGLLDEVGCADAKEYENIPMSKILAQWAKELGIDYDDDIALSKVLTVSTATISRWKNNKTRPPLIGKPGRPGEPGKLGLKQLRELVRNLVGGK